MKKAAIFAVIAKWPPSSNSTRLQFQAESGEVILLATAVVTATAEQSAQETTAAWSWAANWNLNFFANRTRYASGVRVRYFDANLLADLDSLAVVDWLANCVRNALANVFADDVANRVVVGLALGFADHTASGVANVLATLFTNHAAGGVVAGLLTALRNHLAYGVGAGLLTALRHHAAGRVGASLLTALRNHLAGRVGAGLAAWFANHAADLVGAGLLTALWYQLAGGIGAGLAAALRDHLADGVRHLIGYAFLFVANAVDNLLFAGRNPALLAHRGRWALYALYMALTWAVYTAAGARIVGPCSRRANRATDRLARNRFATLFPMSTLDHDSLGVIHWLADRADNSTHALFLNRYHYRVVDNLFVCFTNRNHYRVIDHFAAGLVHRT
jgi:hypothetical protein